MQDDTDLLSSLEYKIGKKRGKWKKADLRFAVDSLAAVLQSLQNDYGDLRVEQRMGVNLLGCLYSRHAKKAGARVKYTDRMCIGLVRDVDAMKANLKKGDDKKVKDVDALRVLIDLDVERTGEKISAREKERQVQQFQKWLSSCRKKVQKKSDN